MAQREGNLDPRLGRESHVRAQEDMSQHKDERQKELDQRFEEEIFKSCCCGGQDYCTIHCCRLIRNQKEATANLQLQDGIADIFGHLAYRR